MEGLMVMAGRSAGFGGMWWLVSACVLVLAVTPVPSRTRRVLVALAVAVVLAAVIVPLFVISCGGIFYYTNGCWLF